jgi:hypothetical protein
MGGDCIFGWALSYQGPQVDSGPHAPLFARWVNHVLWKDLYATAWEVTPRFNPANRRSIGWQPTAFIPEIGATFEGRNPHQARYLPLRPEGIQVAELLNRAQMAESDEFRFHWLRLAMAAMSAQGFTPKGCRVETIGNRTSNIFFVAE